MRIDTSPAWQALLAHAAQLKPQHLRQLFAADPQRFARHSLKLGEVLFDYSKQRLTQETLDLLVELANSAQVTQAIEQMLAGEHVNASEGRAALHVALRQPKQALVSERFALAGAGGQARQSVLPRIFALRDKMRVFCNAVRSGAWRGYTGEPIRTVVNLGIGGSDLGPRMATEALSALGHPGLAVRYVSNLDSADIAPLLEQLNPRTTLFIVSSKTFTTVETLTNARTARSWLLSHANASSQQTDLAMQQQMIAVTANPNAALQFGVNPEQIFALWDWVGGRFSLWSAVGLPLALAIGMDGFEQLLAGAHALDQHFLSAPFGQNIPVLMALIGIWNINFLNAGNLSISPYSQSLHYLPRYLQQLEMESNGKNVDQNGQALAYASAPIIWGDAGSNTQHAYFQLLHQGGRLIPSDFHAFVASDYPLAGHHERLLANCFAQAEALAFGTQQAECADASDAHSDSARLAALKHCPGNQPSSSFIFPKLDPYHLGVLIAAYEHKTFVQASIWQINPFDQWGVELGKKLADRLLPALQGAAPPANCDSSTAGLIAHCHALATSPR
ncbi:MAG: glucose-6-phosphate isomerase [Pseudomonadota bacterium]